MEIQYLNELDKNKKIGTQTVRGIPEEDINNYENQLNIKFPLAYKEFLYLAGSYEGNLTLCNGTSSIEDLAKPSKLEYQKNFWENLQIKIEKPHWIFTDDSETVFFFYLDEDIEDPIVWQIDFWGIGDYEIHTGEEEITFSQFINGVVDWSIKKYDLDHK